MGYLLCPQCGTHRFFLDTSAGRLYFHVDLQRQPVPTAASAAALAGFDFSLIACCGCSWRGGLHKLVRIFAG